MKRNAEWEGEEGVRHPVVQSRCRTLGRPGTSSTSAQSISSAGRGVVTRPEPRTSHLRGTTSARRSRANRRTALEKYNELHIMIIRHPELSENENIHEFVKSVVNEIYGGLWSTPPIETEHQDWSNAWIASSGAEIVGVLLTKEEWIDDLWVGQDHRGRGLGTKLLQYGEAEVAGRDYEVSRLRVVKANLSAISFYIKHGWKIEKEFPHETLPIEMLELTKRSGRSPI